MSTPPPESSPAEKEQGQQKQSQGISVVPQNLDSLNSFIQTQDCQSGAYDPYAHTNVVAEDLKSVSIGDDGTASPPIGTNASEVVERKVAAASKLNATYTCNPSTANGPHDNCRVLKTTFSIILESKTQTDQSYVLDVSEQSRSAVLAISADSLTYKQSIREAENDMNAECSVPRFEAAEPGAIYYCTDTGCATAQSYRPRKNTFHFQRLLEKGVYKNTAGLARAIHGYNPRDNSNVCAFDGQSIYYHGSFSFLAVTEDGQFSEYKLEAEAKAKVGLATIPLPRDGKSILLFSHPGVKINIENFLKLSEQRQREEKERKEEKKELPKQATDRLPAQAQSLAFLEYVANQSPDSSINVSIAQIKYSPIPRDPVVIVSGGLEARDEMDSVLDYISQLEKKKDEKIALHKKRMDEILKTATDEINQSLEYYLQKIYAALPDEVPAVFEVAQAPIVSSVAMFPAVPVSAPMGLSASTPVIMQPAYAGGDVKESKESKPTAKIPKPHSFAEFKNNLPKYNLQQVRDDKSTDNSLRLDIDKYLAAKSIHSILTDPNIPSAGGKLLKCHNKVALDRNISKTLDKENDSSFISTLKTIARGATLVLTWLTAGIFSPLYFWVKSKTTEVRGSELLDTLYKRTKDEDFSTEEHDEVKKASAEAKAAAAAPSLVVAGPQK